MMIESNITKNQFIAPVVIIVKFDTDNIAFVKQTES